MNEKLEVWKSIRDELMITNDLIRTVMTGSGTVSKDKYKENVSKIFNRRSQM